MNRLFLSVQALAAVILAEAAERPPFYMLRLRAPETDDPAVWEKTREAIASHPGCADEVWFSTGIDFPTLDAHRIRAAKQAKAAADCRAMGILPGLQVQATIGHGDVVEGKGLKKSMPTWTDAGRTWSTIVGETGIVSACCACPRHSGFLDYFEEVGRIYGVYQPSSVWIDDDLRNEGHAPAIKRDNGQIPGCFCSRCVKDFSTRKGASWTRETLSAALHADSALHAEWAHFCSESLAEVARRIARGVHAVSPKTHMGYQHGGNTKFDDMSLIFRAMYEETGLKVRSRAGGACRFDHTPIHILLNPYVEGRQCHLFEDVLPYIDQMCMEVETYPRKFSCRTPRGILLHALGSLAMGLDSVSLLITNSDLEDMSWYGRRYFSALAANRACLKTFVDASEGTQPAGLFNDVIWFEPTEINAGVPFVNGRGIPLGDYAEFVRRNGGKPINTEAASSREFLNWYRLADEVSGGRMPFVPLDPILAVVFPRVTPSGELRTLLVVNATIDRNEPTRLKLRGVSEGVSEATWWTLDAKPVRLPIRRQKGAVELILPPFEGWSAGWLDFREGRQT